MYVPCCKDKFVMELGKPASTKSPPSDSATATSLESATATSWESNLEHHNYIAVSGLHPTTVWEGVLLKDGKFKHGIGNRHSNKVSSINDISAQDGN